MDRRNFFCIGCCRRLILQTRILHQGHFSWTKQLVSIKLLKQCFFSVLNQAYKKIIEMLSNELASLAGEVTSTQLAMALDHFKQRQAREEHLDKLATGATGYVR